VQEEVPLPLLIIHGARFDRPTRRLIEQTPGLEIISTRFLKTDSYLLIEGRRSVSRNLDP
jgi:hypothetical protein